MRRVHPVYRARGFGMALTSAALVAGCGGGSGNGGVASAPPPPVQTPTPTPTAPPPPPAATVIAAPARATTGTSAAPVLASPGGPNFTIAPAAGTVFPLLQSMLVLDSDSIDPASLPSTMTVAAGKLDLDVPGIWDGPPSTSGHADLDWTRVGYWNSGGFWDCGICHRGAFVAGYQTPDGALPTSGTATYSGRAEGSVFYPVAGTASGVIPSNGEEVGLTGNAQFAANFGSRSLTGTITSVRTSGGAAWNDIAFSSNISGSAFSGATSVTSAPSGTASLGASATGTVEGRFFGPVAQEAGAVWTLFDGSRAAIGTLSGKQP